MGWQTRSAVFESHNINEVEACHASVLSRLDKCNLQTPSITPFLGTATGVFSLLGELPGASVELLWPAVSHQSNYFSIIDFCHCDKVSETSRVVCSFSNVSQENTKFAIDLQLM